MEGPFEEKVAEAVAQHSQPLVLPYVCCHEFSFGVLFPLCQLMIAEKRS